MILGITERAAVAGACICIDIRRVAEAHGLRGGRTTEDELDAGARRACDALYEAVCACAVATERE